METFLGTNLTLNIGRQKIQNEKEVPFLGEHLTHNMGAFMGKKLAHNMGAFLGKKLTLNMGGGAF